MPPDAESQITTDVLDRYLAGRCTAAELAHVEQWMAASPERRESFASLHNWSIRKIDLDAWLGRVKAEAESQKGKGMAGRENILNPTRRTFGGVTGSGTQSLRNGLRLSALAATIAGVFLLARQGGERHVMGARVYTTQADQQALVDLDDGTHVTLAPNTTLRVPQFTAPVRTVVLESGEAYFEVAHGSTKPFVVRSGELTTRVLGTAFLLRRTAKTSRLQIAVAEGRVRVTSETHPATGVTLEAGAVAEVTDSVVHEQKIGGLVSETEWRNDQLIFHHVTVSAVLRTLSQWYGYQFHCADSALGQQDITIGVSVRSSAAALATLEDILNVNLTVVGDTVTLTSQPVPQSKRAPRIRRYDVWTPTREVGR